MIDRTKPLIEQDPGDLRVFLDALHANRERYDRANRIVEARSCELEIAEATRALAVINCRATEAEDQRAAGDMGPLTDLERAAAQRFLTWAVDDLEAAEDPSWAPLFEGARAVRKLLDTPAQPALTAVDPAQREADLREAFLAGCEHCDGWVDENSRLAGGLDGDDVRAQHGGRVMLPAKVREAIRGLLLRRVQRIVRMIGNLAAPDNVVAYEARLIGDAGALLDPEILAARWIEQRAREARAYARVCVWDGECEADATTDDGLCAEHAAEQAREEAEVRAQVERGEIASEDATSDS